MPINTKRSYTEYVVSSEQSEFTIGFKDYQDDSNFIKDVINVTVDNIDAATAGYTVTRTSPTVITLSPAVPVTTPNKVVRLQRETNIDNSFHIFTNGAKWDATTMDENFEQVRHSQQEVRDGFEQLSNRVIPLVDGLSEALDQAAAASQAARDAADDAQAASANVTNLGVTLGTGFLIGTPTATPVPELLKADDTPSTIGNAQAQALLNSIKYVESKIDRYVNIEDYGAGVSKTPLENATAINAALATGMPVYAPNKVYDVAMSTVVIPDKAVLFGGATFKGQDPDLVAADVTGQMLRIDNTAAVIIKGITIKNGYKGKGIYMTRTNNTMFVDVTIDGFSYGCWTGEYDGGTGVASDLKGCRNTMWVRPRVLNTKYWGMYNRCLDVTIEANKTFGVVIVNPYFYNCNMAAFVCSEGNVNNVVLSNPVFERCNVCMHFETTSDYTVINPRDYDTGKKPDQLPPNAEYPYTNWSMYHAFANKGRVHGGVMQSTCYHFAVNGGGSDDIQYFNFTCKDHVFEGSGFDANRVFFTNYRWFNCTTTGVFIYQLNGGSNFIRNSGMYNCTTFVGKDIDTGTGDGNIIGIYVPRSVNFTVTGCKVHNAAIRVTCLGYLNVTNNHFIGGTNNTRCDLVGGGSGAGAGHILDFYGNTFERAGGTVLPAYAFDIAEWSRCRVDNAMTLSGVDYGYRFAGINRLEYGINYVVGASVAEYLRGAGVTTFIKVATTVI